jgi:magnesium transporter
MARLINKPTNKLGTAPGSFVFVGTRRHQEVQIEIIRFNKDEAEYFQNISQQDCKGYLSTNHITWINVVGVHDPDVMTILSEDFELHPLLIEDMMNTNQRPKFNEFDANIAFILKMLHLDEDKGLVRTEQISLVAGHNYLISFQEEQGDVFNAVRERILKPSTRIRQRRADYLAFALMDAIVDNYILCIEFFGDAIENHEEKMLGYVNRDDASQINLFKREISSLRRIIRPVLELVNQFERSESAIIEKRTLPFVKDLSDHIIQAAEAIEIYKELLNDCFELYNAALTHRLNDIMRVLTIFSVVFIPLTFIAGVYGTNFEYLPELGYRYAYPIFWAALIVTAVTMLTWFYRKRWL